MRRRSLYLTIVVGFFLSFSAATAAFAQFAGAQWKRWDWSIPYPGDAASSAVAPCLSPSGASEHCYFGPFAEESALPASEIFELVGLAGLGKCKLTPFAAQFSRVTRWFHDRLPLIFREFGSAWDGWLSELKCQQQMICCIQAAMSATESRQRAEAYWSYYQDRTRWLGVNASSTSRGNQTRVPDDLSEFHREKGFPHWFLISPNNLIAKRMVAAGTTLSRCLEFAAIRLLKLDEHFSLLARAMRFARSLSNQREAGACECNAWLGAQIEAFRASAVTAVVSGTSAAFSRIQNVSAEVMRISNAILALVPIEAIGFVSPD